ncbi:hypothetical protein SODALDRAFT_328628 [Sodiomyces alkalinus F11]|uniref:Uncharacterized protein n=1 Tax=Sodiomyces alkalinus (strain CBS 110278 / VKM F-3762 / F11) TaxID=1314773 RepID=A0A3N2PLA6_SODAK|nr:hypothetical protein SODALDRAFT_328628 [Sodiomyces alkalinus F11]ROT35308.1 hypothetical protein SODALDRAFT_328628 [Sodiomyces alkalinus F11]
MVANGHRNQAWSSVPFPSGLSCRHRSRETGPSSARLFVKRRQRGSRWMLICSSQSGALIRSSHQRKHQAIEPSSLAQFYCRQGNVMRWTMGSAGENEGPGSMGRALGMAYK